MSDSIALHLGRDGFVHMFNLADVPHFDTYPPIFHIILTVNAAGYRGVWLEEKQLENGRFLVGANADPNTPEGQIVQTLMLDVASGKPLPSIAFVLAQIKDHYDELGRIHE